MPSEAAESEASDSVVTLAAAASLSTAAGTVILGILAAVQVGWLPEYTWLGVVFAATWMPAFIAAAYGPLLMLSCAAAVLLARRRGEPGLWQAWLWIGLGLLAAVASYSWVLDVVELP